MNDTYHAYLMYINTHNQLKRVRHNYAQSEYRSRLEQEKRNEWAIEIITLEQQEKLTWERYQRLLGLNNSSQSTRGVHQTETRMNRSYQPSQTRPPPSVVVEEPHNAPQRATRGINPTEPSVSPSPSVVDDEANTVPLSTSDTINVAMEERPIVSSPVPDESPEIQPSSAPVDQTDSYVPPSNSALFLPLSSPSEPEPSTPAPFSLSVPEGPATDIPPPFVINNSNVNTEVMRVEGEPVVRPTRGPKPLGPFGTVRARSRGRGRGNSTARKTETRGRGGKKAGASGSKRARGRGRGRGRVARANVDDDWLVEDD